MLSQMVAFIKQEANEKAHEILIRGGTQNQHQFGFCIASEAMISEEEFNIEKLRMVEQEKVIWHDLHEAMQKLDKASICTDQGTG
jgi:uncharacterized protein YueI